MRIFWKTPRHKLTFLNIVHFRSVLRKRSNPSRGSPWRHARRRDAPFCVLFACASCIQLFPEIISKCEILLAPSTGFSPRGIANSIGAAFAKFLRESDLEARNRYTLREAFDRSVGLGVHIFNWSGSAAITYTEIEADPLLNGKKGQLPFVIIQAVGNAPGEASAVSHQHQLRCLELPNVVCVAAASEQRTWGDVLSTGGGAIDADDEEGEQIGANAEVTRLGGSRRGSLAKYRPFYEQMKLDHVLWKMLLANNHDGEAALDMVDYQYGKVEGQIAVARNAEHRECPELAAFSMYGTKKLAEHARKLQNGELPFRSQEELRNRFRDTDFLTRAEIELRQNCDKNGRLEHENGRLYADLSAPGSLLVTTRGDYDSDYYAEADVPFREALTREARSVELDGEQHLLRLPEIARHITLESGTSLATPLVSAVAAVLAGILVDATQGRVAGVGQKNPSRDAQLFPFAHVAPKVVQILRSLKGNDHVPCLESMVEGGKFLNMLKAVKATLAEAEEITRKLGSGAAGARDQLVGAPVLRSRSEDLVAALERRIETGDEGRS